MIIKKHQTLFDFTVQHAGTMESLIQLAMLNGISITEEVTPGTDLLTEVERDSTVGNFFIRSGYQVHANYLLSNETALPGGIGYMQISNDFKVS
jgi:hypothetical protein